MPGRAKTIGAFWSRLKAKRRLTRLTPATAADERRSDVPRYFIENEKVLVDVRELEHLTLCLQSRHKFNLSHCFGCAYQLKS
jgi:hypothetical protein